MTLVNIKFNNTLLSLESDNEERVIELNEKLNKRIEHLKANSTNTTDTKLAIISALMLEDQLDTLTKTLDDNNSDKKIKETQDAFINTILDLTNYIEQLAETLEKS